MALQPCCAHRLLRRGNVRIRMVRQVRDDIALWDLKGQALDQPVHVLLGGALRERVPAYVTGFSPPSATPSR